MNLTGYTLDKLADGRWHILYWRDGEFIRYVCQCASEQVGHEECAMLHWLRAPEENSRPVLTWRPERS